MEKKINTNLFPLLPNNNDKIRILQVLYYKYIQSFIFDFLNYENINILKDIKFEEFEYIYKNNIMTE
jgi:hypothetical protein